MRLFKMRKAFHVGTAPEQGPASARPFALERSDSLPEDGNTASSEAPLAETSSRGPFFVCLALAAAFLAMHAALVAAGVWNSTRLTFLLAGVAYAPAVVVTFLRARRESAAFSRRWLLLSVSLFFNMLEPLLAGSHLPQSLHFAPTLCLIVAFTLCLLIVASPRLPQRSRPVQAVDLTMAAAVCLLCAAAILLPQGLFAGPDWLGFLSLLRLIPAAAALFGMCGALNPEEYNLMRAIALFQGLDFCGTLILNQVMGTVLHRWNATPIDFVMEVAPLTLALTLWFRPPALFHLRNRSRFIARSGLPLFLALTLCLTAAWLIPRHFVLGLLGVAISIAGYGLRSTLVHSRALQAEQQLRDRVQDLRILAERDPLTNTANRRRFDQAIQLEWRRAHPGAPLALLLLDLDYFKHINDRRGHLYGDRCLRAVAEVLGRVSRHSNDLVCRFGGDEFALILPNTDLDAACLIAQRVCDNMRSVGLEGASGTPLTVSIGVATCVENTHGEPSDLLSEADTNLYKAKRKGRNRVHCTPTDALRRLG